MKKQIQYWVFVLSCVFLSLPSFVFASSPSEYGNVCFEAASFGTASANGLYTQYDVGSAGSDGVSDYSNGTFFLASIDGGQYWDLDVSKGNTGPTYYYISGTSPVGAYSHDALGSAPPGFVASTTCPGQASGSNPDGSEVFPGIATSSATTIGFEIVDNPTQDLAYGLLFFLGGMWLMLWLFKRRN